MITKHDMERAVNRISKFLKYEDAVDAIECGSRISYYWDIGEVDLLKCSLALLFHPSYPVRLYYGFFNTNDDSCEIPIHSENFDTLDKAVERLPLFLACCIGTHNQVQDIGKQLASLGSIIPMDDESIVADLAKKSGYGYVIVDEGEESQHFILQRRNHWLWNHDILIGKDGPSLLAIITPPDNVSADTRYISYSEKNFLSDIMRVVHEFESMILAQDAV
jgi:hypothetical protein